VNALLVLVHAQGVSEVREWLSEDDLIGPALAPLLLPAGHLLKGVPGLEIDRIAAEFARDVHQAARAFFR